LAACPKNKTELAKIAGALPRGLLNVYEYPRNVGAYSKSCEQEFATLRTIISDAEQSRLERFLSAMEANDVRVNEWRSAREFAGIFAAGVEGDTNSPWAQYKTVLEEFRDNKDDQDLQREVDKERARAYAKTMPEQAVTFAYREALGFADLFMNKNVEPSRDAIVRVLQLLPKPALDAFEVKLPPEKSKRRHRGWKEHVAKAVLYFFHTRTAWGAVHANGIDMDDDVSMASGEGEGVDHTAWAIASIEAVESEILLATEKPLSAWETPDPALLTQWVSAVPAALRSAHDLPPPEKIAKMSPPVKKRIAALLEQVIRAAREAHAEKYFQTIEWATLRYSNWEMLY